MHCNPIFFLHISPVHITVFQRQELGPWRSGVTNMGKKMDNYGNIYIHICRSSRLAQKPSATECL